MLGPIDGPGRGTSEVKAPVDKAGGGEKKGPSLRWTSVSDADREEGVEGAESERGSTYVLRTADVCEVERVFMLRVGCTAGDLRRKRSRVEGKVDGV